MQDPQAKQPPAPSSPAQFVHKWGLPSRLTGIIVLVSLSLPWCGTIKGTELMVAEGLERFWIFPALAAILIVVPFVRNLKVRSAVEIISALALAAATGYFAWRLGKLRGIGLTISAVTSSLMAVATILIHPVMQNRLSRRSRDKPS